MVTVNNMPTEISTPVIKSKIYSPTHKKKSSSSIVEEHLLAKCKGREILFKTTSIRVLNLSGRAFTRLRVAKINTIEQLIDCSETTLLNIPHVGVTTIEEIKYKLNSYLTKVLYRYDLSSPANDGRTISLNSSPTSTHGNSHFSLPKFFGKVIDRFKQQT